MKKAIAITGTEDSKKLRNYIRFFDGLPVEFVHHSRIPSFEGFDALFLIGGDDIEPSLYGEENLFPDITQLESERDRVELSAIEHFERQGLPVFGICRGIQIINVYFGGTLWQDIPEQLGTTRHKYSSGEKRDVFHEVIIRAENPVFPVGQRLKVNSFHHQSVKGPGRNLTVFAYADDGIVEGLIHREKPILAIQWHPERLPGGWPAREGIRKFIERILS